LWLTIFFWGGDWGKGKVRYRHNTYIAPQAASAATVALYVTG